MDTIKHFKSLTAELQALENRVRNFIDDAHWQTDGEWKESVLRSVLRRLLPRNVEVGRGFVVSPTGTSGQIDVLIYSAEKPVLFRDGDLVFVTHDALLAMIEVKTGLDNHGFAQAAARLAENAEKVAHSRWHCVVGLFAYEDRGTTPEGILEGLRDAAGTNRKRIIDMASVGPGRFVRWWHCTREGTGTPIDLWRSYRLEEMAPAYFIHNVVHFICPDSIESNQTAWFPAEGKESHMELEMRFAQGEANQSSQPIAGTPGSG